MRSLHTDGQTDGGQIDEQMIRKPLIQMSYNCVISVIRLDNIACINLSKFIHLPPTVVTYVQPHEPVIFSFKYPIAGL